MNIQEKRAVLLRLGLNPDDALKWTQKRDTLRANTTYKPYDCSLSFEQYVQLAAEAGLTSPEQVGRVRGSYQMARIRDAGNYEIGNCRFVLQAQNIEEKHINGGTASAALKKTGRTKLTCPGCASIAEKAKVRMLGKRKATHPETAAQADKLSKCFKLTSPEGEIFIGKNLEEFCKSHGIASRGCMSRVCSGKKSAHKGWTGTYISKEEYNAQVGSH